LTAGAVSRAHPARDAAPGEGGGGDAGHDFRQHRFGLGAAAEIGDQRVGDRSLVASNRVLDLAQIRLPFGRRRPRRRQESGALALQYAGERGAKAFRSIHHLVLAQPPAIS